MTTSPDAVALGDAVERLLTALVRRRRVLGDDEPSPLSAFQGIVLSVLVDAGPLRLGALAEELRTTDATASRTIDVLVAHGLAERRDDPGDRRGVLVAATGEGRRAVHRRRRRLAALLDRLVADLAPDEGRRLSELLGELSELLARHGS